MPGTSILRRKRILLVDDEKGIRDAYTMLLDVDGHHVVAAADASEALGLFEPAKFDLVITDLDMPGMKGNELAVELKKLSPAQRILMITAHPVQYDRLKNPVDGVLNKPFTFEELRQAVAKALS